MAEIAENQEEVLAQNKKRLLGSPCGYEAFNPVAKKNQIFYPAVSCHGECDRCGWNPEVKKQRVDKMLAEIEAERAKRKEGKKVKT